MSHDLPEFFFRIRENGATVFRVDTENRQRRIEMDEIAIVNIKNGQIKPHGSHELTKAESAAIENWMAQRIEVLTRRDMDDIHRAVDHLNLTAQWVQSRATDAQLEEVTDTLLLTMHDLRSALVKRKAERLMKKAAE